MKSLPPILILAGAFIALGYSTYQFLIPTGPNIAWVGLVIVVIAGYMVCMAAYYTRRERLR